MDLPNFDHVTIIEVMREADTRLRRALGLSAMDPDPIEDWVERTNRDRDDAKASFAVSEVLAGGTLVKAGDLLHLTVKEPYSKQRRMLNCHVLERTVAYRYGERSKPLDTLRVHRYGASPKRWAREASVQIQHITYAERVPVPEWIALEIEKGKQR